MTISVHPVLDEAARSAFFAAQRRALGELPAWRPAPQEWEQRLLDTARNPLFEHVEMERFVAERDGTVIGRIVAWVDDRRPELGFFGFFDVCDDLEAGRALAWVARDWCRARGRSRIRGPIDFWTICSAGTPVSGFELPNTFALHHGAPHYSEALLAAGFRQAAEVYTWQFGRDPVPPPAEGIARATMTNEALSLVDFDAASADHWSVVEELYTSCYVDHDWFPSMSRDELRLIASSFVEPAASLLAFVRGTPAAMSIGLRNVVETSVRVGDVIPPEPIQRVFRSARRSLNYRLWLFGVAPDFRGRALGGLGTTMYVELRRRAADAGLERGEAAWTQQLDGRLSASFTALGGRRDKTYRVFEATMNRSRSSTSG